MKKRTAKARYSKGIGEFGGAGIGIGIELGENGIDLGKKGLGGESKRSNEREGIYGLPQEAVQVIYSIIEKVLEFRNNFV